MRRWILIMLLIVYPFQVALAMADRCCVMTSAGLTHHSAGQGAVVGAEPVFLADDEGAALTDPHCPACSFAHHFYLPSDAITLPAPGHDAARIDSVYPFLPSPPVLRLERPKWPAA